MSFQVTYSNIVKEADIIKLKGMFGVEKDSELLKKLIDIVPSREVLEKAMDAPGSPEVLAWATIVNFLIGGKK